MGENPLNQVTDTIGSDALKDITDVIKKANSNSEEKQVSDSNIGIENTDSTSSSTFKVASTNLPEKTGFWTKLKNALFYEIKVELTPYQQKVEKEINDFLHQEITWKSLKEAALSEVPITFRGKRIF